MGRGRDGSRSGSPLRRKDRWAGGPKVVANDGLNERGEKIQKNAFGGAVGDGKGKGVEGRVVMTGRASIGLCEPMLRG